ncbi:protein translocase SEC61 complex subunit gamma [Candidatus Woesearchaeota archaeon]|nr:protein translocase SEC61 complex subunit gamma [Candidatus Woesearchaeota archaeon]
MQKVKSFFIQSMRVLRVTKKPDSFEYKTITKVSGLGIAAIGIIGFILALINQLLF